MNPFVPSQATTVFAADDVKENMVYRTGPILQATVLSTVPCSLVRHAGKIPYDEYAYEHQ